VLASDSLDMMSNVTIKSKIHCNFFKTNLLWKSIPIMTSSFS